MIRNEKAKIRRYVIIGILAGIAFFILSYVSLSPLTLPGKLIAVGEKVLSRSLGTTVTIERARVHLFRPKITVEGLSLPRVQLGKEGGGGSIFIHRAEFELERFQVLSGNVSFRRVLLERPDIRLEIAGLAGRQADGGGKGLKLFSRGPRLKNVEVWGGTVQILWPESGFALQTDILDFVCALPSLRRKGMVRLRTQGGQIAFQDRKSPLVRFEVDGEVGGSGARIDSLALITEAAELFASGELEGMAELSAISGTFHGRIDPDLVGPIGGQWELAGDLIFQGEGSWGDEGWSIRSSLDGTRVRLAGLEFPLLGGEIRLDNDRFSLEELRVGVTPPGTVCEEEPVPLGEVVLEGALQMRSPYIYALKATLNELRIAEIAASLPGGSLEMVGRYLWTVGAMKGSIDLRGYFPTGRIDPKTLAFRGTADLAILSGVRGWELTHLTSEYGLEERVFRVDTLSLASFQGSLEGEGELGPGREVLFSFVADPVDLFLVGRVLNQEISGEGFLRGTVSGTLEAPEFEGEVDLSGVRAAGVRLGTVRGKLRYSPATGLKASQLTIRPPGSDGEIILAGDVGRDFQDVSFWGERIPIRSLWEEEEALSGTASGKIFLSGRYPDVRGRGKITIQEGSWAGEWGAVDFDALEVAFVVEDRTVKIEHATVSQKGGRITLSGIANPRERTIDGIIEVQAVRPEHVPVISQYLSKLGMEARGPIELGGRVRGRYGPVPELFGELEAVVRGVALGEGEESDLNLRVFLEGERAGWKGGMPGIDISGQLAFSGDMPLRLEVDLDDFDFSPWLARITQVRDMRGLVKGSSVRFTAGLKRPESAEVKVEMPSLVFGRTDYYLRNRAPISISWSSSGWAFPGAELEAVSPSLKAGGRDSLGITVAPARDGEIAASGSLDLFWLVPFWEGLSNGSGEVTLEVVFRRKGATPSSRSEDAGIFPIAWEGRAELKNTVIQLSYFDQKFEEVSGLVTFNDREVKWDSLRGKSAGGTFDSDGEIFLSSPVLLDLGFRVNGVGLDVIPWFPMWIRGTMRLSGEPDSLALVGEGEVLRARVSRSIDVQMVVESFHMRKYRPTVESRGTPSLTFNLHMTSEGNVIVSNNLAEARLRGDVFVRGNVLQPELVGVLEAVEGKVFFRDNIFLIQSGRIEFLEKTRPGEPVDPWIEVAAEASRETSQGEAFTIKLLADGLLSDLKVRLSSVPERDEKDILTFLAYGRFYEELQGQESGITAVEAGSLVVGKAIDSLEGKIETITGVDRVQIEPAFSESGNTAIPRLLVRKRVGEQLDLTLTTEIGGTMSRNFLADYHFADWFSLQVNWDNEKSRSELGNFGADVKMKIPFQ